MKVLAHAAGWEAFSGTTSDGAPMCGVSDRAQDVMVLAQVLQGRRPSSRDKLKGSELTGKAGEKTTLRMKFDDGKPWRVEATAFKVGKETALEFKVDSEQLED